jgi:hypothetical protein
MQMAERRDVLIFRNHWNTPGGGALSAPYMETLGEIRDHMG